MRQMKAILIFLSGAIALFFMAKVSYELWRYGRLSARALAEVKEWSVQECSESKCLLQATYTFTVDQVCYAGKATFQEPVYLNLPSAQKAAVASQKLTWYVWYQPNFPKNSSLQRTFPFKTLVHMFLTLGVFGYFCVISRRECNITA